MKYFFVISFLLTLHIKYVLGIIGGLPVWHRPFFVEVRTTAQTCGGTLIAADAVLTSAKCLVNEDSNRFSYPGEIHIVKNRERNWVSGWTLHSIKRFIEHPMYNPIANQGLGPNDIAVVLLGECIDLSTPMSSILQLCTEETDYRYGLAMGRGLVLTNPPILAEGLMEVLLYQHLTCSTYFPQQQRLIDDTKQVCFGTRNPFNYTGLCTGDYGGPLIHEDEDGNACLIGVASFAPRSCADPEIPSVFGRVSHFKDWIQSALYELNSVSVTGQSCDVQK